MFSVSNSVKQGGVLSPILFSIYLDGLLSKLNKKSVACHMENYFVGCLAYADDLTLIVPSRQVLQIMISICEGYAADYDVILMVLKVSFQFLKVKIVVNSEKLKNITSTVHLGHCMSTLNTNSLIDAAGAQFWKRFNIFSADFGHIYPFLQCRLFTQYCCSFYLFIYLYLYWD